MIHPFYLGNPQIGRAMEAAMCAHDQGKFLEYEHALYQAQGQTQYSVDELAQLATDNGLDSEALIQCLTSGTHRDQVEQARLQAVRLGVNSTPTFFINDQRIEGNVPYPQFQQALDQELAIAQ